MTKTRKITYIAVAAGIILLFVLGTLYDLAISKVIYQPDNFMAKILESAGIFPPFIFVSATFVTFFFLIDRSKKNGTLWKILCGGLSAVPYLVYGFMASETYLTTLWARVIVAVVAAVILTPLTFFVIAKLPEQTKKRLAVFLVFASIVAVISSLISINVIKYLWGRARYREMIADSDTTFTAFTPWYHPNGFTLKGHHSFPSGHTCSATNLLALCALEEVFDEKDSHKKLILFLVGMYIFVMAYSRLVLGAHFLSDVTGGFLVGFVTYAVVRYLYFDRSKTVLGVIMKLNGEGGAEKEKMPSDSQPSEDTDPSAASEMSESFSSEEGASSSPVPDDAVEENE